MSEAAQRTKETLLHFGGFTLNLDRRGLYRGSERVHLTSKPLETLILLVENRTHVVEKQTILDTVWNGTFVTDDVLVQSVREIRRVLKDDKENPSFIQTVPRQGYRFVGAVTTDLTGPFESISDNGNTPSVASVPTANQIHQGWATRLFAREHRHVLWLLVLVGIGGLAWVLSRSNLGTSIGTRFTSATPASSQATKNKTKTLLTTGRFSAGKPSLSADGKLMLFVSSTESTRQTAPDGKVTTYGDLFVRELATGNDIRITERENPSGDIPVFTADGSHVVFSNYHYSGRGSSLPDLYSVRSGGGANGRNGEPFIREASGAGFSPDGQWVAYTKHLPLQKALWLSPAIEPETAHREIAPKGFTPRWSWDGSLIAYTTSNPNGGLGDLFIVDAAELTKHRNLTNEPQQIYGLTWTPDGKSIVFASKRSGPSLLWRVSLEGGPVEPVTELTGDFAAPSMSRVSNWLVFSHYRAAQNLMTAEDLMQPAIELSSDEYHRWCRLSPSGALVASVMEQPDLGKHLYVTDLVGNHLRLSELPAHHPSWAGEARLDYLQWDSDKQQTRVFEVNLSDRTKPITTPVYTFSGYAEWLAMDPQTGLKLAAVLSNSVGGQQVVVVDLSQNRQDVIASGSEYANLRWSPDGSTLAWSGPLETDESSNGIWLLEPGAGAEPRRISIDGYAPVWNFDGTSIYFSTIGPNTGLWEIELSSKNKRLVRQWKEVSYFDVVGQRLVFCQLGSSGKNRIYSLNVE